METALNSITLVFIIWTIGFFVAILLSIYVIFTLTDTPPGLTRPFTDDKSDEKLDLLVAFSVLFSFMLSWIWVIIMGVRAFKHYFKTLNSHGKEPTKNYSH